MVSAGYSKMIVKPWTTKTQGPRHWRMLLYRSTLGSRSICKLKTKYSPSEPTNTPPSVRAVRVARSSWGILYYWPYSDHKWGNKRDNSSSLTGVRPRKPREVLPHLLGYLLTFARMFFFSTVEIEAPERLPARSVYLGQTAIFHLPQFVFTCRKWPSSQPIPTNISKTKGFWWHRR